MLQNFVYLKKIVKKFCLLKTNSLKNFIDLKRVGKKNVYLKTISM